MANKNELISINIHPKTVFIVLFVLGLLWLGVQVLPVLVVLFVAFIVNAALRPLVDKLEQKGFNRAAAIMVIYLLLLGVFVVVVAMFANQLLLQLGGLLDSLPAIYNRFAEFIRLNLPFLDDVFQFSDLQPGIQELVSKLSQIDFIRNLVVDQGVPALQRVLSVLGAAVGLLVTLFTTLMISVYMLMRKERVQTGLIAFLPSEQRDLATKIFSKVESSLGAWVLGQLALMLIVGVTTYIALELPVLFVPGYALAQFALPIAIVAGLLEALPSVGPLIAMVFAGVIALGTGGLGALVYVVAVFLLIQNLEAVFLVPQVMKKSVGLDPIVTILSILAALQLGGVVAALLVVPVVAAIQILVLELLASRDAQAVAK